MHRLPQPANAPSERIDPALIVIAAGVCAALHVGKLAPAIPALQDALKISLLQAGFLLSLVQLAGMSVGVLFGLAADGLGLRRSMLLGLLVLAAASALGGSARDSTHLMLLRACEGFGFLLVVVPAPGLIRRLVAPGVAQPSGALPPDAREAHRPGGSRLNVMLGLWGAYMPLATALALLLGPLCIDAAGWRAWWWGLAGVTLLMAAALGCTVRGESAPCKPTSAPVVALPAAWPERLRRTLAIRTIWLVAIAFGLYAGQWLAVLGFLPAIATQAGVSGVVLGVLTALVAAVNVVGNIAAGRLLHAGVAPPTLLRVGFVAMALGAVAAFAGDAGAGLPPALRFAALLLFSMFGGLIPTTLFALAVPLAPSEDTIATTLGWVQQWSAFGQFAGPPLVAWFASVALGWHWTWLVTAGFSVLGLVLVARIARA